MYICIYLYISIYIIYKYICIYIFTSDISMFAHTISDFWYNSRDIYLYNPIACMLDEGIRTSISQIATRGKNPAQVLGFNI